MHTIVFGISSNAEDRETKIHDAIEEIKALIPDLKTSDAYSSPCYNDSGPEYLAVVAKGDTEISADRLEVFVKAFEWNLGRDRDAESNGIVIIDIDIVVYDDEILKTVDYESTGFAQALASIS